MIKVVENPPKSLGALPMMSHHSLGSPVGYGSVQGASYRGQCEIGLAHMHHQTANMAEAAIVHQHRPRSFHEQRHVLDKLSDAELIKRCRLNREGILLVNDFVQDAQ